MINITVRNIPNEIMNKIKTLSKMERRSINNEIIMVLERGLQEKSNYIVKQKKFISIDTQINLWNNLANSWEDTRTTREIIDDIYNSRTIGREIDL